MADMILTRRLLDTKYASWFHSKRNTEQAKQEILSIFFRNPTNSTNGPNRIFMSNPERL